VGRLFTVVRTVVRQIELIPAKIGAPDPSVFALKLKFGHNSAPGGQGRG
jgi:hypothetical protein